MLSRKLFFTIFVLALFAFSGMALAGEDVVNAPAKVSNKVVKTWQPTTKGISPYELTAPDNFNREDLNEGDKTSNATVYPANVTNTPDNCPVYFDYFDFGYSQLNEWRRPGGDDRELGTRYDVPKDHFADMHGVYVFVAAASDTSPDAPVEIEVKIYGDDAGLPDDADLLLTDVMSNLPDAMGSGWNWLDLTGSGLTIMEENFHVTIAAIGSDKETVHFYLDDGALGVVRLDYRYLGTWYHYADIGADSRNLLMEAGYCAYYTSCSGPNGTSLMTFDGAGYVSFWLMPDPYWSNGCTVTGFGQRYISEGPDSIKDIVFRHWDLTYFGYALYPVTGGNDVIIEIWDDDGTGQIDLTGPLATRTIIGTRANLFPTTGGDGTIYSSNRIHVDFASENLVMLGPWHVTAKMSTDNLANGELYPGLSYETNCPAGDDCTDGYGASVKWTAPCGTDWERQSTNADWQSEVGNEYAFLIYATLCRDEFYECETQVLHEVPDWTWEYPLSADGIDVGWNWVGVAQYVVGNPVNRLDKMRFLVESDQASPDVTDVRFIVYGEGAFGPGAELWSVTETPTLSPGWHEVVIPGGLIILGNFYIGMEVDPVSFDASKRMWALTHEMDTELINDGAWVKNNLLTWGGPDLVRWYSLVLNLGWTENFMAEADFCAIPVDERSCFDAGMNHTSLNLDQARTGGSDVSLGDAHCDLTLDWHYRNVGQNIVFAAPLIYNDKVVIAFSDHYRILDLMTGAVLHTISGSPQVGAGVRCTPVIATVDVGGGPEDMLFISGASTRNISAYHFDGVYGLEWTSPFGSTDDRYGGLVVVTTSEGVEIVTWSTEDGNVYASLASDGTLFADWTTAGANPVALGLNTVVGGTTDGTDLYYTTVDIDAASVAGDVYKLSADSGLILWQLSVDGGLEGDNMGGWSGTNEGFLSAVTYDAFFDVVYANSSTVTGDHPADGVFYAINAGDGTVATAAKSARSLYTAPIIDQVRVYLNTFSRWVTPPLGGNILAFRRPQGDLSWASGGQPIPPPAYRAQMALSCETGLPDLLFAFDEASIFTETGFLSCFNADNGNEIFRRRMDHLATAFNSGGAVTLGRDSEGGTRLLSVDIAGNVYCMTSTGEDRPRLEITSYRPRIPVEFGFDPNYMVNLESILHNSGCATLTGLAYSIDTVDSDGASVPSITVSQSDFVRPDVIDRASSIANKLAGNTFVKNPLANDAFDINLDNLNDQFAISGEKGSNRSALAGDLDFLNGVSGPASIGPGDSADITLDINQLILKRGPHPFYIIVDASGDPDFFLNNAVEHLDTLQPRIYVTVAGGCLVDTVQLDFGMGAANFQLVSNTGRLGTGDWGGGASGSNGFAIDGDLQTYYQGSYIYGISKYRIAMNTQDWSSGGGELDGFFSMQPDPNWCDDQCTPFLSTTCELGLMSDDGLTYSPVVGGAVCKTYIDSVQSYYDAGDAADDLWTWDGGWDTDGAFDDTLTIGLMVTSTTYGVSDVPRFHNFTLEIMTFTERNGEPVDDWYFGHFADYDIGSDLMAFDAGISAGWATNPIGGSKALGSIKIPFGCGYDPAINAVSMYGNDGLWTADPYYDSAYLWMSTIVGIDTSHNPAGGDAQGHITLASHDFAGSDSYTFGVAFFGSSTLTDAHDASELAPIAHAANKWAGFGRGDVDDDGAVTIADVIYLNRFVGDPGSEPGPIPFMHLGDVDASGGIDAADVDYLKDYYFECGPCPLGEWADWTGCDPNP